MKKYELSDEDLKALKEIATTPVMMLGGTCFDHQAEANSKWKEIGDREGFDYMTVRPIKGHGIKFFQAEEKSEN